MDLRFTAHADEQMEERKISTREVEEVIAQPNHVSIGGTAIEYDGVVNGRPLHVVVVRDSDPPVVITVYVVRR